MNLSWHIWATMHIFSKVYAGVIKGDHDIVAMKVIKLDSLKVWKFPFTNHLFTNYKNFFSGIMRLIKMVWNAQLTKVRPITNEGVNIYDKRVSDILQHMNWAAMEITLQRHFAHINVVTLYDAFKIQGYLYILMNICSIQKWILFGWQ